MRVLSVKQPWADAIVFGPKRVENRTWLPAYRGLIALHASLERDREAPYILERAYGLDTRGAVIGTAYLVGAHRFDDECRCDHWAERVDGVTHLLLGGVRRLAEPVPWRGALGLRQAGPELERMIEA